MMGNQYRGEDEHTRNGGAPPANRYSGLQSSDDIRRNGESGASVYGRSKLCCCP
ncbi:TPA: hypothetical protein L9217_005154 [Klebsiella aerogenes]|nr:hypothetical protein [Klebsiella aerogenes]